MSGSSESGRREDVPDISFDILTLPASWLPPAVASPSPFPALPPPQTPPANILFLSASRAMARAIVRASPLLFLLPRGLLLPVFPHSIFSGRWQRACR